MSELSSAIQQKEKTAQFMWTGFILMFFLIQAIIWTIAISLTAGDQSHAIIEGYDERALNWDDEVALRHASQRLGWQVMIDIDPTCDIRNFHDLAVEIKDASNEPVTQASIQLTAFHRAYAAIPQEIELKEIGEGVYAGKIRITKSGNWKIFGQASRGNDVFLIDQQFRLKASR